MPIDLFRHIKSSKIKEQQQCALSTAIHGIYFFQGDEIRTKMLLFNDGYPSIIFSAQANISGRISSKGSSKILGPAWICCGAVKNSYLEFDGVTQDIFVVRMHPSNFYEIFDVDKKDMKAGYIENLDVASTYGAKIIKAFYQIQSLEEKHIFLEKTIVGLIQGGGRSMPPLLNEVIEFIDNGKAWSSVKEILLQWKGKVNYKWLERNFRIYYGLSPQEYILMQRFLNLYLDAYSSDSKDVSNLAFKYGYCDQNHLIKDFRKYTGTSPKKYEWQKPSS